MQIYEFHISKIIIHHLDGLFGPNILTSSQWACYLSRQSAAPVSQRSWVQIPYRPEFFWPKQVHGIFHVHLLLIRVDKTVSNIPNQNSYMEICPTLVTRRKKSLFISLPNSKLTISLIYIYKYYAIDIADPSSMQDACHMNFVIDLAYRGVSVA